MCLCLFLCLSVYLCMLLCLYLCLYLSLYVSLYVSVCVYGVCLCVCASVFEGCVYVYVSLCGVCVCVCVFVCMCVGYKPELSLKTSRNSYKMFLEGSEAACLHSPPNMRCQSRSLQGLCTQTSLEEKCPSEGVNRQKAGSREHSQATLSCSFWGSLSYVNVPLTTEPESCSLWKF